MLIDPAIGVLAYAMNKKDKSLQQALQAANSVLDRTGHGVKSTLEVVDPATRIAALQAGRQRAASLRELPPAPITVISIDPVAPPAMEPLTPELVPDPEPEASVPEAPSGTIDEC